MSETNREIGTGLAGTSATTKGGSLTGWPQSLLLPVMEAPRLFACFVVLLLVVPVGARGMEINIDPTPSGGGSSSGSRGVVQAQGNTKAEAYAKASGKLPRGAVPSNPTYTAGGKRWTCDVRYSKKGVVTGDAKDKAKAYERAMAQLPHNAAPGNIEYSKAGGRHVCKVHYTKNGRVTGYGGTKSEAYSDAVRQLPPKAAPGNISYSDSGGAAHRWLCEIPYRVR
jgi:hypothetical protein